MSGVSKMAPFRAKRLDLGCFVNKWVLRDHTKRKVFAEHEVERSVIPTSSDKFTTGYRFCGFNG